MSQRDPLQPKEVDDVDLAIEMIVALRDYHLIGGVFGDFAAKTLIRHLKSRGLRVVRYV